MFLISINYIHRKLQNMHILIEKQKYSLQQWSIIKAKVIQQLVDEKMILKNDRSTHSLIRDFLDAYLKEHGKVANLITIEMFLSGY